MVGVRCFQIQKEKCNFQRENVFWDHFTITCHFQTFSRKKYGYEHAQFYNVMYTLKWMDTKKSIIPYVVYALKDTYQCICNLDPCISEEISNLIVSWIVIKVNLCNLWKCLKKTLYYAHFFQNPERPWHWAFSCFLLLLWLLWLRFLHAAAFAGLSFKLVNHSSAHQEHVFRAAQ